MGLAALRYVHTCAHEGSISTTITNIPTTTSTSPRSSSSGSSSSRRHQQRHQKWQAHKIVVLLFGLYYCHDSPFSKINFRELTLVAAYCKSPWRIIIFWMLLHSWFGQPTRSWTEASGVHPIIPPLLSTEAPDAAGPSRSGGHTSSPCRRVSGLGGPELLRPMLLLRLRPSSSWKSAMMGWFHAVLTSTYWNEICRILSQLQLGAAHEVMDEAKFKLLKPTALSKKKNFKRFPLQPKLTFVRQRFPEISNTSA